MKVHTRMVIETDPEVKQMANHIKYVSGCSVKEIIEKLLKNSLDKNT